MMLNRKLLTLVAVASQAFVATACVTPYLTESTNTEPLSRKAYAAIGAGVSKLDPNDAQSSFDVNDRVTNGGQITVGIDVNKQLSVELHAADLGSAGFSPNGEISYQTYGISGLLYMGKNRHRNNRKGLTAYGRLGVSAMNNKATGDLLFRNEHSNNVLVGAGLEYSTQSGIGLRSEVILFDEDAVFGQLGIIYRFGNNGKRRQIPVELVEAPAPKSVASIAPLAAIAVIKLDDDNDGITNPIDQCKNTIPNAVVDTVGCILFGGVLEGVNFVSNSDALTQQSKTTLDNVARTLQKHPSVKIVLSAHTDSYGKADYNLALSQRRLVSVVSYLSTKGVNPDRTVSKAYGETQPIASNDSSEGRKRNRRVAIFADKATQ